MSEQKLEKSSLAGFWARHQAELAILAVCAAFLTQVGRSDAIVFDPVGPERIPLFVIGAIAFLAVLEILSGVLGRNPAPKKSDSDSVPARGKAALFVLTVVGYLVLLAQTSLPYYFATALFFAISSLIIVERVTFREVIIALALGLVFGLALQFLFTQVFVVDLPT